MHYEKLPDGSVKCIEDEIPFELPERWEWCRLGVITEIYGRIGFRGYTKDDLVEIGEGAITLSPSNIINSKLDFSSCTYISWVKYDESPEIQLAKNDIVLVKTGSSYGKSAIVDKLPEKTTLNPQFVVLKNTKINSSYACMYLQSTHSQNLFREFVVGTAIPTFSQKALSTLLISCPPISEQHRIVEKLNELLSFVDTIESDKTDLQATIQATKSKILDLAIRGKLVPQDPNDEPASVLLERIKAEKEELIKQGKIKRDKKESVIFKGEDNSYYEKIGSEVRCIDEELPFEVSDSWAFARLKHIGEVVGGGTPKTTVSEYWNGEIPWLTPADFSGYEDMYISAGSRTITEIGLQSSSAQMLPTNSILYSSRAPIGYIAINSNPVSTNQGFKSLVPFDIAMTQYLYYCLKARTDDIVRRATGTTFKEISGTEMAETIIPLPPINEQKRIFEQASQMLKIITKIEKSLS